MPVVIIDGNLELRSIASIDDLLPVVSTAAKQDAANALLAQIAALADGGGNSLTESIVTMSGASDELVAANPARTSVMVFNADANDVAVIGLTNQTVTADQGMPLQPGDGFRVTGTAAQSAMSQIGTADQKLTVYVG